jgi:hypothetical protein
MIDFALAGAAISVDAAPPIGSEVAVGGRRARVVRHFVGGVAVEFSEELIEGDLEKIAA